MARMVLALAASALLATCEPPASESERSPPEEPNEPAPAEPRATGNSQDDSPTTAVPQVETADAVAARFGDLLEERRFAEARGLYAENGASEARFAAFFDEYATIDATVGGPARIEGAAGSLYAEVPLSLTGELDGGEPYTRSGLVTLRRANNVPGATAEQLRWRIVRLRLGSATL